MSSAAPNPEATPELPRRRVLLIIGALMLGTFLAALDQTIVATALPTIVGDLHGASHLSWVITAYLLATTVSTPLWGKLGDQYGRKRLFQTAIAVFVVGSAIAGLSQSMLELIAIRALQGLGAGGLLIGAQAIVGDVVSPRQRGRYQGLFGAVFGVATLLGPLLGGFFVDYLSWRWVFYVNLPIGVVALLVTSAQLPSHHRKVRHVIDYAGTILLALATTALVLITSLGGTSLGWASAPILALAAAGIILTVVFVFVEGRAAEPILPLRLFANRVFSTAGAIGFVLGFAMFGALTFLPIFFQDARGFSPTKSGLQLLPLVGGLLLASVTSGRLVSRWGRYKVFPVVGTFFMVVGLYLLSTISLTTGGLTIAGYLFVFGTGLGLVLQILIVATQNAVRHDQLGTATSGVTFFRSIGGSFGTAVFGAVFANVLARNVMHALHLNAIPPNLRSSLNAANPTSLARLPRAVHAGVVSGMAHTIQTVFLISAPIAAVAFALSWLLPDIELRTTLTTDEPVEAPDPRSPVPDLQLAVDRLAHRENQRELYATLAQRGGLRLDPRPCWLLFRLADHPDCTADKLSSRLKISPFEIEGLVTALIDAGLLEMGKGPGECEFCLTKNGRQATNRLLTIRRAAVSQMLGGRDPDAHPEIGEMIRQLAYQLHADGAKLLADATTPRNSAP